MLVGSTLLLMMTTLAFFVGTLFMKTTILGVEINYFDEVKITGIVVSEKDQPRVEDIKGVVGEIDDEGCIKVWPFEPFRDGKLWFSSKTIEAIEVINE